MSRFVLAAAFVAGCAVDRDYTWENGGGPGDEAFDGDDVVHAGDSVCEVVPDAETCIERNPVQWAPPNADVAEQICNDLGYECCDQTAYISEQAALCIAEGDPRIAGDVVVRFNLLACDHDFEGPIYGVWVESDGGDLEGIGVHAVTGAITWYNDGSGIV